MTEDRWARAQKRPGGQGVRVYLSGEALKKVFDGTVPEEIEYCYAGKTNQTAYIQLRGVTPNETL